MTFKRKSLIKLIEKALSDIREEGAREEPDIYVSGITHKKCENGGYILKALDLAWSPRSSSV